MSISRAGFIYAVTKKVIVFYSLHSVCRRRFHSRWFKEISVDLTVNLGSISIIGNLLIVRIISHEIWNEFVSNKILRVFLSCIFTTKDNPPFWLCDSGFINLTPWNKLLAARGTIFIKFYSQISSFIRKILHKHKRTRF